MAWQRTTRTAATEKGIASRVARVRRGAALLLAAAAITLTTALSPIGVRSAAPEATPGADSPMARALAAYEAIQAEKALPPDWSPASVVPAVVASAPAAPAPGFAWPATGTLTQGYGCTGFALEPWSAALGCYFHEGLDIANVEGTVVVATAAGQVTWAGWTDDGYGYSVQLDHGNGLTSRYGHLCCAPPVLIGQQVARGEPIGLMGTTGASTGPHLHFTIHLHGQPVDPWGYLG